MARLWSYGAELQSAGSAVEFDSRSGTAPTIDTVTFRSGLASLKFNPAAATSIITDQFTTTSATNNFYVRFYAFFTAFPTANSITISLVRSTALGNNLTIRMNTAGTIFLNNEQSATQVGSTSSALNLSQWYRIEYSYVNSTGAANAYIDGTNFATGTANTNIGGDSVKFGVIDSSTATWFLDDVAINDQTGSFQTGLPGAGAIIHLQPNATGDNNSFTVAVGGTAGAANDFTRNQEITPDDATSYNGGVLNTDIDDFNITDPPASIGTSDTINVVQIGVRYNAAVAAAEASFQVRAKKAASGTVSSSTAITPTATAWVTNANAAPKQYPLTLYQDPDGGTITKSQLTNWQIGYNISTTNTNAADISTVWMLVDSTPSAGAAFTPRLGLLGVG